MVAEGYKETEIGVIPVEWEVKYVRDIAKIKTGKKDTQDKEEGGKYPFFVRSQTIERINSYSFDGEAVLTAGDGVGVGKIYHYLNEKFDYHQRVYNIHNFADNVSGRYFYEYFKATFYSRVSRMSAKNSVDSVRLDMIAKMEIPLPPLKEQEKIADILSTADEKIDTIASQIQKAETLKKGLLQKLLSEGIGHSEFKDSELGKIPESWEVVELGSFSKSISKKNRDNKITDVVSVTKYNGIVNSLEYFNKKVFSDNITTYKIIERNQFAYATIHLDEGSIGFLDIFDIAVLSPMYSVFEIDYKRVDRSYFYSLVKSHKMIKIYEHIGLGSVERRKSISFNVFNKIKIPFPPLKEQKQIADILSTADEKLEVLRAKKEKYETLKKGLLQKLLSGEVRV